MLIPRLALLDLQEFHWDAESFRDLVHGQFLWLGLGQEFPFGQLLAIDVPPLIAICIFKGRAVHAVELAVLAPPLSAICPFNSWAVQAVTLAFFIEPLGPFFGDLDLINLLLHDGFVFGYMVNIPLPGNWCPSSVTKRLNVLCGEKCDPGPGERVNGEFTHARPSLE